MSVPSSLDIGELRRDQLAPAHYVAGLAMLGFLLARAPMSSSRRLVSAPAADPRAA